MDGLLRRLMCIPTVERKHEAPLLTAGCPGPQGDLPAIDVALSPADTAQVVATQSGPDGGIQNLQACAPQFVLPWDHGARSAYGESTSLYDLILRDDCSSTSVRNGEPVADCYGLIAYGEPSSGAILAVADGVNWGEPARRAARCAVLGALQSLHNALTRIATEQKAESPAKLMSSTIFQEMIAAVHAAQALILRQMGTLTTLVLTVILQQSPSCSHYPRHLAKKATKSSSQHGPAYTSSSGSWAAMTLTVGDSAAWVWRAEGEQVEELTAAAHQGAVRDMRFTPGALGYALGEDPDLSNMTASITLLQPGDVVFLGSDGIADNFNAEVCKLARAAPYASEVLSTGCDDDDDDPQLPPPSALRSCSRATSL